MHLRNIAFGSAIFSNSIAFAIALEPRSMTSDEVVSNINMITISSRNLQEVASAIRPTLLGLPLDPNEFQPLIKGLKNIISDVDTDIANMQGAPLVPFSDPMQAQTICTAFREFVHVHQELLNIVIDKSGLIQGLFGGPVAAVLRSLEGGVDSLAYSIIYTVPTCAADATGDLKDLDGTIKTAICAYSPLGSLGIDLFC